MPSSTASSTTSVWLGVYVLCLHMATMKGRCTVFNLLYYDLTVLATVLPNSPFTHMHLLHHKCYKSRIMGKTVSTRG